MYIQMIYNSITSILYRIKALSISDIYIGNTNKYRFIPIYTGSICYLWHIYLSVSYQNIGYLHVNSKCYVGINIHIRKIYRYFCTTKTHSF